MRNFIGFVLLASLLVLVSTAHHKCDTGCAECKTICMSNGNDMCYDDYEYLRQHDMLPQNVYVLGYGSCSSDYSLSCVCCQEHPIDYVCGSDNRTYKNLCELLCVSKTNYGKLIPLVLMHVGKCRETPH